MEILKQLVDLITLKALQGKRTQITIVIMGIINVLVQLGYLHLSPDDLVRINQGLLLVMGFFFSEKMSKK